MTNFDIGWMAYGKQLDVYADETLVANLMAIVTMANEYLSSYTGPGGEEIAFVEMARFLAAKSLKSISIKEVK